MRRLIVHCCASQVPPPPSASRKAPPAEAAAEGGAEAATPVMAEVDSLPERPTSIDATQLAAAAVGLLPADLLKEVAKWLQGDVAAFVRMGATCRLYNQVGGPACELSGAFSNPCWIGL